MGSWSQHATLADPVDGLSLPDWVDRHRYETYQQPLVEEIVGHFNAGNQLVILQAPTGAGKTTVAEATRQTLNYRGLYLCSSLTLMDQFLADFPYARLLKGRRNYIPTHAPEGSDITCDDCTFDVDTGYCDYCKPVDGCPYKVARSRAVRGRLPCSNTSYFLREVMASRSVLAERDLVVLDEADRAEDEVLSCVSISISPWMSKQLSLLPPEKKTKQDSWQEWFAYSLPIVKDHVVRLDDSDIKQARMKRSLERTQETMEMIAENLDQYVYMGYESDRIEFKPLSASRFGHEYLWQQSKRWLAMSATIGSPEMFVESLGFKGQWSIVSAPSCFDPARRPVYFYPAAKMTNKTEETEAPKLVEVLKIVLDRHPDERVLVHTHSKKLTRYLYDALTTDSIRPIFTYLSAKDRKQAIEDYESTPAAVLLAMSLERGYSGNDEKVRVVVLAKVPYPYLGDKVVNARAYGPNGKLWYASVTADAIAQAFGRGMRHHNDHMTGYILDSQFSVLYSSWLGPRDWMNGGERGHRLFAGFFTDALKMDDADVRWEIRQVLKSR